MIFVFGSNRAGIHGAGAAKFAREKHQAILGIGEGMAGNSYAIPTKDERIETLPLSEIKKHVDTFLNFAKKHPSIEFQITAIGCGFAGYNPSVIAPMFEALDNCYYPNEFKPYIFGNAKFWGTFE